MFHSLLSYREFKYNSLVEHLAGTKHGRRIVRLIGTVREMLALNCNSIIVMIGDAILAGRAAIKPVAGVNLHAGLGGIDRQLAAAFRRIELGRFLNLTGQITVNQETVVIAFSVVQGREKSIGVPATGSESPSGIRVSSVGRYSDAARQSSCPSTFSLKPDRLK